MYPESTDDFLKHHDARLIGDDEHGSILADLNYLWRAVEKVPGLGYCLRVVVWTVPGPCGLHSRRYTGTSPWPTFPEDEYLRNWLRPVVAKGVPRTWLGVSPFSKNRLLKTIARTPRPET